jgi:hypothetical protein
MPASGWPLTATLGLREAGIAQRNGFYGGPDNKYRSTLTGPIVFT